MAQTKKSADRTGSNPYTERNQKVRDKECRNGSIKGQSAGMSTQTLDRFREIACQRKSSGSNPWILCVKKAS